MFSLVFSAYTGATTQVNHKMSSIGLENGQAFDSEASIGLTRHTAADERHEYVSLSVARLMAEYLRRTDFLEFRDFVRAMFPGDYLDYLYSERLRSFQRGNPRKAFVCFYFIRKEDPNYLANRLRGGIDEI